jgi:hypothetical protein
VPTPTDTEEPGTWGYNHRRVDRKVDQGTIVAPAVEPTGRGARVEGRNVTAVLAGVEEHVGQRVANLARRTKIAAMIAIRPDATAAAGGTIQGTRGADHETAHAGREGGLVAGLDDEVQVVSLDREVDEAEVRT